MTNERARARWRPFALAGVFSLLLVQLVLAAPASAQQPGDELFAATAQCDDVSSLYTIDPNTGARIRSIGSSGWMISGIAFDPTTGVLYGSTPNCGDDQGHLIRIDPDTGQGTLVGDINPACTSGVPDITFLSDGTLYGWEKNCRNQLVQINKSTGEGTGVGPVVTSTNGNGLAADPNDVIWHSYDEDDGDYVTINPATGARTSQGTLDGLGNSIGALAWTCDGRTLFGTTNESRLITIDTATDHVSDRGHVDEQQDAIAWRCAPPPPPGRCKGKAATIVGTSGNDVITGTPNRDVIVGRGGKDRIVGLKGNDLICAGAGRDKVSGSGGNDRIFGQGGNDNLRGSKGNDRLNGGGGNDRCHGGPGTDKARKCEKVLQVP